MTTDTVGGVWQYSIELCRSLAKHDVHFFLVTAGGPLQSSQKEDVDSLENVTLYESDYLLEWMPDAWESIDNSNAFLLKLEQESKPDIVHLNSFSYGSLNWKAPTVVVAHSDVFSWWQAVKGETPSAEWNEYFERVSDGLNNADYFVAPSNAMMKAVKDIYHTTTPGEVIYNGRNSTDFTPAQKQLYIFSMGRLWDEAKNIQLLLKAAPFIPFPIRLAGDNNFASDRCTTEGDNILYLGKLSSKQVAEQLSAASLYVLPAKYEPFGLSILEAALSGCALVLGDIDSLREIWGDSAVYVDTNDEQALAELLMN
jgi:glycosyltransferase involved in cell wall biosynthesis